MNSCLPPYRELQEARLAAVSPQQPALNTGSTISHAGSLPRAGRKLVGRNAARSMSFGCLGHWTYEFMSITGLEMLFGFSPIMYGFLQIVTPFSRSRRFLFFFTEMDFILVNKDFKCLNLCLWRPPPPLSFCTCRSLEKLHICIWSMPLFLSCKYTVTSGEFRKTVPVFWHAWARLSVHLSQAWGNKPGLSSLL